ncbi:hypothetical protein CJ030_MR0G027283 [Morella rubra]|uniref:TMV resistance protein N n=1 Tax=Morella rubra TaxID=262757 RepID=A0A6A1UET7_9ROSI|nr:hypothetical protein CJ030_MR0G027283 [Morella rubra]
MPNLASILIVGCRKVKKIGNELEYNGECSASASAVPTWENKISSAAKSTLSLPCIDLIFSSEYRKSLPDHLVEFSYTSRFLNLDLLRSDIVRPHASIKRLDGLRKLHLQYCEKLQEISELPPNIIAVYAGGCNSLESFPEVVKRFQFSTSDCKKLDWIDLSGCHKMHLNIENHVPKPDSDQVSLSLSLMLSFLHYLYEEDRNRNSYKIQVERKDAAKIKGILVCAVISANTGPEITGIAITVKGFKTVHRPIGVDIRGSDHVWLEYFEFWDREDEGEACDLRIYFTFCKKSSLILKKVGAYLVRNNEERAEYHPRMRHDAVHVHGEDIEHRRGKRLRITKF